MRQMIKVSKDNSSLRPSQPCLYIETILYLSIWTRYKFENFLQSTATIDLNICLLRDTYVS